MDQPMNQSSKMSPYTGFNGCNSSERPIAKGGPYAPPGFRVAPRAVFVVTAIRRQSLPPSRLRRCALCLPPGDRRKAHPRRAMLGAPGGEPNRLAPDRPGQRPTTDRAGLGGCAGACCRRLHKYVPPSTLAVRCLVVTKDGSRGFTDMAARPCFGVPNHASSMAAARYRVRCRQSLGIGLARVRGRAAETDVRGCRAGHASFRRWIGPRRPCLVVNPGGGAGLMSATFQPK